MTWVACGIESLRRRKRQSIKSRWKLNQPTPPLERSRVVVPDRAQSCRQASNVVFFRLGFLQVHHVEDGTPFIAGQGFLFSLTPGAIRWHLFRLNELGDF